MSLLSVIFLFTTGSATHSPYEPPMPYLVFFGTDCSCLVVLVCEQHLLFTTCFVTRSTIYCYSFDCFSMQSPFLWSTLMIVIHLKLAQQERSCYLRITPAITGTYHVILPPVYRSTSSLARTTCMHARIYACRYTHIYICVYTYVRISVCVLLCVCIYIYT